LAQEDDIKFIPWPYRCKTLRGVVLGILGVAIGIVFVTTLLQAFMPGRSEWDHLPKGLGLRLPHVLGWFGTLLIFWIIAFLRFFRHRANAFVKFQIRETSKIWISYRRGLLGDYKTAIKDDYLVDEPQSRLWGVGSFGFLLQPERGNAANDGQRHPQAIQTIKNLIGEIKSVDYFRTTGFRIAFSRASIADDKSYTLRRPKRNEDEPSFFKKHIELVALNVPDLPLGFYLARLIWCALVSVAIFLIAWFTRSSDLNQFIPISVLIMTIFYAWWISVKSTRNRYLQEHRWVLYFPQKRMLKRHSGDFGPGALNVVENINEAETGPLHQLLNELWLMSRFTDTDIKVVEKSLSRNRRRDGQPGVLASMKLTALSIWHTILGRSSQDSNGAARGNGR
jgi:hypothetical protein